MVYVAKVQLKKELNLTRKRGITRKPLNPLAIPPRALKPFRTTLNPQFERWLAESWTDNKELYMALKGR